MAVAGDKRGCYPRKQMALPYRLHEHLGAWRRSKGLSQEQVANTLGHHKSTINRWESGARAIDLADLQRLAELYGIDPVALLLAPSDFDLARELTCAKEILSTRDPKATETWLAMGRLLPEVRKDG